MSWWVLILLSCSMLIMMDGQILFDNFGERQMSVDYVFRFMRMELEHFSQSIKDTVQEKLDRFESNIENKIGNILVFQLNESLSKCQNELHTVKQEMVFLRTNFSWTFNKQQKQLMYLERNVSEIIENNSFLIENTTTEMFDLFNRSKLERVFDEIRNSSAHLEYAVTSGEQMHVLKNIQTITQFLLKVNTAGYDCADILEKNPEYRGTNAVYNILVPPNNVKSVYCDMTTDDGGWTVIQRRINGLVNFDRNWTDYKNGFGYADNEYWIGNDMLHILTTQKPQQLRIDLESFSNESAYAVYSTFSVGNETSNYKLRIGGYSGNAGDSLFYNNNKLFSTPDRDNSEYSRNCATADKAGWWFNWCTYANPNGLYGDTESSGEKYVVWRHWKNSWRSLKTIQMMIRPRAGR